MVMYNTIIDSLCKDKLISKACDLYSEMIAKGIFPNVVTYTTLMYGLCLVGQLKEATDLINEMLLKTST